MSLEKIENIFGQENFETQYLTQVNAPNLKNSFYLYYNPNFIKNYNGMNDEEIKSIEKSLESLSFCAKTQAQGIKSFGNKGPSCKVIIDNKFEFNAKIKYELKTLPKYGNPRIGLLEFNFSNNQNPSNILFACIYLGKDLYAKKNKNYQINLSTKKDLRETNIKHNYNRIGLFARNNPKNEWAQKNTQKQENQTEYKLKKKR